MFQWFHLDITFHSQCNVEYKHAFGVHGFDVVKEIPSRELFFACLCDRDYNV